jgi:hypothetical protein
MRQVVCLLLLCAPVFGACARCLLVCFFFLMEDRRNRKHDNHVYLSVFPDSDTI